MCFVVVLWVFVMGKDYRAVYTRARGLVAQMYMQRDTRDMAKTPLRPVRIGDDWEALEAVASQLGTDRSAMIRAYIEWALRKPGAKLPPRAPRA